LFPNIIKLYFPIRAGGGNRTRVA